MAESMLRKEIDVYSQKYDIKGVIKDYGVVTKLLFTYQGKEIEMAINVDTSEVESLKAAGQQLIDSYVSNLVTQRKRYRCIIGTLIRMNQKKVQTLSDTVL